MGRARFLRSWGSPRGRFAPYILGVGLLTLALALLLFALYAALLREVAGGFLLSSALAAAFGALLLWGGQSNSEPTRREALIGVLLLWLTVPFFGALPFALSGGMTLFNAVFESMSGFTTTGATVLRDFNAFGQSLFMWRAFIQWVGGVGIIVLFIAVFPQLALAGRQLFFSETPGPTEERLTPRLRNTASAVLLVYVGPDTSSAPSRLRRCRNAAPGGGGARLYHARGGRLQLEPELVRGVCQPRARVDRNHFYDLCRSQLRLAVPRPDG